MSWAARRRFTILLIIGAVAVAFLATLSIATFYKAPSCADGSQNQGETGIDCGGPCAYLCTASQQPPTVLFTKAIQNGAGRIDVVAEVENKNPDAAAKNVPYRITLYGADRSLIQEVSGTLDLPPGATVPVFVPGVSLGTQTAGSAFLSIQPSAPQWFASSADLRVVPKVSNITLAGAAAAPRVEAVFTNPSVTVLVNVRAIVLVHSAQGDVIAASATIVSSMPAQGEAKAVFTWDSPFPSIPASIEVVPVIPLPDQ
ncbi:TPA: hypothetical protein DIV48_01985 [Candidatus Kaiserbacteria bacterium]|nr:MAG: hypothetical protein UY93_C0005G0001 [Parcubacteria group bacterium GW2011_GWA1_56_13]KKW45872.1 MAG: hypothetical protein UY97_C0013G0001 [Parcubacteria group bacterium GW2011_GWB1_57_6]HCR52402.1 hypothetical protein [Candidatus Kaiserbacteria bacterium]